MAFRLAGILIPPRFKPTEKHHAPYGFGVPYFIHPHGEGAFYFVAENERIIDTQWLRKGCGTTFKKDGDEAHYSGAVEVYFNQPALYSYHYPGNEGRCGVYTATRDFLTPVLRNWLKTNEMNIHDDALALRHAETFCQGGIPEELEAYYAYLSRETLQEEGNAIRALN